MKYFIMILMCLFTSSGQVLVKKGIEDRGQEGASPRNIRYYFEYHIIAGGLLILFSPFLYLKVLKLTGLSGAFGLNGISYIIVYLMGVFILKEKGSFLQTLGIILITGGIVIWSI